MKDHGGKLIDVSIKNFQTLRETSRKKSKEFIERKNLFANF